MITSVGKSYGLTEFRHVESETARVLEDLRINGYAVLEDVIPVEQLDGWRSRLDDVYRTQVKEVGGAEKLKAIRELNVARCPLLYDDTFINLATIPAVVQIAKAFLGEYIILHLQNGIINTPNEDHHQSSWHRDLPYQNFVSSQPLALNAMVCLDPFNEETGATQVIPFTHREDKIPTGDFILRNAVSGQAKPGSVLFMDSMILHRAGYNSSSIIRRGVNHVYTAAILRQQLDLPKALKGKYADDPFLNMLLGYGAESATSVLEYREARIRKSMK